MLKLTALAALLLVVRAAEGATPEEAPPTPAPPAAAPATQNPVPVLPSDSELEASGEVVCEVEIDNRNIFDLSDPKENNWLFRIANRLHVRTKPSVIRSQLLFKSGDLYSRRLLEESERILRLNVYFYDASVRPVRYHDGKVDVRVTTRDVWTLNPGFNYGRSGGTNTVGGQLEDLNFLGTGADLLFQRSTDIDRTVNLFQLSDSHLFGSWLQTRIAYSKNSDGTTGEIYLNRPFYALDSREAAGIDLQAGTRNDFIYDLGEKVDEWRERYHFATGFVGWSAGLRNGWAQRWSVGATYDEHDFMPQPQWVGPSLVPQSRKLVYPFVQYNLVQDDYVIFINHDQIARSEDFYLGTQLTMLLGYASRAFGSLTNSVIVSGAAGTGFNTFDNTTLLISTLFYGRLDDGSLHNASLSATGRYYIQQTRNALFFTTLTVTETHKLDLDNQLLLGGDSGLRGYPLRYQSGTGRALLTVEERYFTDWYPFRLWRVGGAVFGDAGRTWGSAPLIQPSLGWLTDAGVGLRFGNARSGLGNVTHVDIAFPFQHSDGIKSVQFLVTTEQAF